MAKGAPAGGKSSTNAGKTGEKVENVKKLLEVFAQMDTLETDPEAKDMIKTMADTAKQYMAKLEGTGGGGSNSPVPAASSDGVTGGGMAGAGMPPVGSGGAGAGAGVPA